jgi:hypothetical protein
MSGKLPGAEALATGVPCAAASTNDVPLLPMMVASNSANTGHNR